MCALLVYPLYYVGPGERVSGCSRLGMGLPENTSGNGDISPLHLPEPVSKAGLSFSFEILLVVHI